MFVAGFYVEVDNWNTELLKKYIIRFQMGIDGIQL